MKIKIQKLVCSNCDAPLTISQDDSGKWTLACIKCNGSPVVSGKDLVKVMKKWFNPQTRKQYQKRLQTIYKEMRQFTA